MPSNTRRLSVLVADDNPDALAWLAGVVYRASPGARIVQASDGYAALRQAEQVRFDLAVLDYQMPGFNGSEVARILRTRGVRCEVVTSSPISPAAKAETTPKDDVPARMPGWVAGCRAAEKVEPGPVPAAAAASSSSGRVLAPA